MFLVKSENDVEPLLTFKHAHSHARRPRDLRYMKILRNLLRWICSWPYQDLGEEAKPIPFRNIRFLFVEGIGVWVGGLIYIRTHYTTVTFLEMGQTYLTVFFGMVAAQRVTVCWFKSYQRVMKEFVLEMHLFHHRHKSEFYEHIYQYIHRICAVFVTVITAELYFGTALFNLVPLFNNYMKGMFNEEMPPGKQFEHSINFSLPIINYYTNLTGYIVIAIMNLIFTYDSATYFCAIDLTISVIVFHIWGHLKILDHNLRSIPSPRQMRNQEHGCFENELSYTKEENKQIAAKLKNIVDHHRAITRFMTSTSDAFGPTLCLYYMFHQVSGCILLLECSEMDTQSVARYGALTITLFQLLIQMSCIVELLGSQSETLKDAVYSVPWEYMDCSNRKIVLFLLYNVQEPIRLKPMGVVSVGVQTMATILKTSFSYFMLLRTFD